MADDKKPVIRQEAAGLVADETLCVTKDGRLVSESHPQANLQIAVAGRPIPEKFAARYGIKPTAKAKAEPEPEKPKPVEEPPPVPVLEVKKAEPPAETTEKHGSVTIHRRGR